MNIFVHEWKQNARGLLPWCLGMLFLVGASIGKTSGMAMEGGQSLEIMVSLLPKALQHLFGFGIVDFGKPIGIFAIIALYIALVASYHACGLGGWAFAKEERDRTFEFLYVRGRTRTSILLSKVLADLLQLVVLNAFTFMASVGIVYVVENESIMAGFLPMMAGILVLQCLFYALGLMVSFFTRQMRTASSVTSGIVMALFLIFMLTSLVAPESVIAWISPFQPFDGKWIFMHGLSMGPVVIWMGCAVVMIAISFRLHAIRDLHT